MKTDLAENVLRLDFVKEELHRRARELSLVTDDTRAAAKACAIAIASDLDTYWGVDLAPEGPIKVVDMFSGCGGMSVGFKAASLFTGAYTLASAIDIDTAANQSYHQNIGILPSPLNVQELARKGAGTLFDTFDRSKGRTVLIGCAPCQGFSSHRNSAGAADPRNSLFTDFFRICSSLKPSVILAENVPEIATDAYWPLVMEARSILENAGYYVHLGVHNMAEFSVPQQRYRALLMAMRTPFRPPEGFLGLGEYRTVQDAIGHLPPVEAGKKSAADLMHFSAGHKSSTIETIRAVSHDGGNRPPNVGPKCLARAKLKNGRAAYEDVYGRLHWNKPAITITGYARNPASGRFVHPEQDRGLTIREAALLQSFPSEYTFSGSLDRCFRQIGNAVPPRFSAYLAMHTLGELISEPLAEGQFDRGITMPLAKSFARLIPALKAGHRQVIKSN